jgi:hypothetical protein
VTFAFSESEYAIALDEFVASGESDTLVMSGATVSTVNVGVLD